MTARITGCPPHRDIAAAAGVTTQAVRMWASGQRRAPASVVLVLVELAGEERALEIARQWHARWEARR